MLIQFTVGNFLSFKRPVTLSMVASRIKEHESSNIFAGDGKLRLLRSAVIYGANASGKSNLIKAFSFLRSFALWSAIDTDVDEPIEIQSFKLNTETENKPSSFEAIFLIENIKYRYGCEVDRNEVHKEWLYHYPKNRESKLYVRNGAEYEIGPLFKEGRKLTSQTRRNALFLSVVAQFNGEIAGKILLWFKRLKVVSGLDDSGYRKFTIEKTRNSEFRLEIMKFLKAGDIDIQDIDVEELKTNSEQALKDTSDDIKARLRMRRESLRYAVSTIHQKYDSNNLPVASEKFNMNRQESEGTKKLYAISGPILDCLQNGNMLIIDELDSRLHPILTQFIIKLFNSDAYNKNNSQLIFASHDTNSLSREIFRRDQIWFTEKDKFGSSDLYSLVEYKLERGKIRNDASYAKDYILGKYGAVPFIGKFKL